LELVVTWHHEKYKMVYPFSLSHLVKAQAKQLALNGRHVLMGYFKSTIDTSGSSFFESLA